MIEENNNDKWWWAALLILVLLFVGRLCCQAQQIDTIQCKPYAIMGYIEKPAKKTTKYFVVYKDGEIQEIISIAKSVVEYIEMCNQHGIVPNLGIVVKNGTISRVIKNKVKYERHKNK